MTPRRVQRILDDIVDAGVIIVTLNDRQEYSQDRLDSDPTALLIALMVSWHAHEESKVKAQRLSAAWAEKRRRVRDGTDAHRAITRAVPLSGTVSQVNANIAGNATEATGFMDRLFKVTPGLGAYLPARIDALGNEVDGRVMGLAAGTTSDTDPLTSRIAALGIDITNLRKADPAGFDLTGEELSELRRIRATEATNADGLTMRETLEELLDDPEFQALPSRDQKQAEVVAVMGKFNEPARELFEERNQQYLADREGNRSLKAYIAEGIERDEAAGMAREDVVALELPEPSRLPQ